MIQYDDFNDISPARNFSVPEERLAQNPLITERGFGNYLRLKQNRFAPVWNFETGDRVVKEDLEQYHVFCEKLGRNRPETRTRPSDEMTAWIMNLRDRVPSFKKRLPDGFDLENQWTLIPTSDRNDMAARIETLVPMDVDLSRLIVYETSGTTGHAIRVPHHPGAMAKVLSMMLFVLDRRGIHPEFSDDMTACFNVGAQANTVVFANVLAAWNQAGFAKINFHQQYWRKVSDAQGFFTESAPVLVTGDPVGFIEMMRWEIRVDVSAMLSTALSLDSSVRESLEKTYRCPVIDWYSTTETGPIGYMCDQNHGFHIISNDIFVEVLDETSGKPAADKVHGEIVVTGGRNPYLPLLRYRTGDHGWLNGSPCACGDPAPRIMALDGRKPVLYHDDKGGVVNPVDVGRLLRHVAMARYRLEQRSDNSLDLFVQPIPSQKIPDTGQMTARLRLLFGNNVVIRVNETDSTRKSVT